MAFPATPDPQGRAFSDAQTEARALKSFVAGVRAQSVAGAVGSDLLVALHLRLVAARDRFNAAAAVPGIGQYAKDQYANQALDIVAEFTAMTTQVTACVDWIVANFPAAAGFIQDRTLTSATPGLTVRQFSIASLVGLRTQLDALLATIN